MNTKNKFTAYFPNTFSEEVIWRAASVFIAACRSCYSTHYALLQFVEK